ncbi:multidrug effflux MFS transporter [Neisseria leonii]|uniref:Bcr/CflA family efflux transporter n=1 Tax=Neisseria leonii TaxID=2995413 RepID=A0A9X4E1J7_9NEIS|nr:MULTISPECIES: multidrug effflux MFS transporter [unclassified Neisseria]MDD9326169.1 multidrug effflux MFS transporter [Neisseria sp. 3986]MDD9327753.1 multidrug effflux MFS transporter [Neisseria sp. 51.81]
MAAQTALGDKKMAVLLATIVAVMPLSIDAYLPAIPALAVDLAADVHRIEKSLSTFMFGVALGQLCGGSISDVKGRKTVALAGLAVYVAASLALALLQTVEQLLVLRLVQAVGGGMAAVMAGAVVRDFYRGRQAAQMFALIGIIMMAAPLAAPMLGSLLQTLGGWRLIFAFLVAYAAAVFWLVWRFLPASGGTGGRLDRRFIGGVLARYYRVVRTKPALGFLFFQAFSFGSMFVFLTESPFVYMTLYGLSPHAYAWVFGCNILTMAAFNRITAWRLKRGSNAEDILKWGIAVQLAANLAMAAAVVAGNGMPPLVLLVVCAMVSVGTQGLIVANTQACFMGYFRAIGGSANALLTAFTSLTGALTGWLATVLHNGTAYVMPLMMLASTLTGLLLLWAFSRRVWMKAV